MKKVLLLLLVTFSISAFAQEKDIQTAPKKLRKDHLFTGGSVNLGFSSNGVNLGASPIFGYSITNWADVGISFNVNYVSQRDAYDVGDKLRQTLLGPGVFTRLFPVKFLFVSAQYEYNFIKVKYTPIYGSYYTVANHLEAPSLLLGAGYAGGRDKHNNTYYYFSISWDVIGDRNSPYINEHGAAIPIIRAGYNIGLFQRGIRY